MAELLVGAAVTVLIEKLLAGDFMKFARSQGIDSQLKKWKETLPMIQAVLADAAQKQITQKPVELWLVELQDLIYDIEDVLDDIATEAVPRNFQESSNGSTSISRKVLKMIPTPHNFMYGRKMRSNLDEITTRLAHLYEQRKGLGLKVNGETSTRTYRRLEETSLLPNVSEILGRDGDKEALLGKLLEDEGASRISIVSIVGMGGIGKTTLARLLYNDEQVKRHFELRAWVCVSNEFDVFSISKQIYQAVVGEDKTFTSLDLLHVALKEELSKKRFLLVLDDVWNEDHKNWEALKQPLVGARGSKVIVTTRNTVVASMMDSVQPYNLGVLPYEIALSLFAQYALEEQNFDKHPSLKPIAQGIIKKCGGLPLALVTIGRVLKTKGNDAVEWEELLNSEIWSSKDESGILPALKLSYYHLPSHLKQAFAYCSLYPKDYPFDKNKLVLKWIAQGFLSRTRGEKSMEMLGHGYFEELRLRCFFQPSTDEKSRYTMHDLMHDLAISVGGKFFFMLDDKVDKNGRNEDFDKFRHFSFMGQRYSEYRKFKELHRARHLRSFLAVGDVRYFYKLDNALVKSLTRLEFLRVLSLTNYSIAEVPQSIGNLKHLRYLNLSRTSIQQIPEEIGELYNLQTLLVHDCDELSSLPKSLVNLKNLRHLDMAGTPLLEKTPLVIGGLTSLQALPIVCIERGNGFKLSQLKGLSNLQGTLSIKGLHNVIDPTEANEANEANLQQKVGLDDLSMEWWDFFFSFRDPVIEYVVLEKLRPPSKLKKLSISFYGGVDFPSWLSNPTSFDRLSSLTLRGCENCKDLPTLGHLSSLESLEIDNMKCLETWMTGGGDNVETFQSFPSLRSISIKDCWKLGKISFGLMPSLETLEVEDLLCLERWSTIGGDDGETPQSFPSLRAISINRCWKLGKVSFGLLPSLKDLALTRCPEAVLRDLVGVSSSIRKIKLHGIVGLTHVDREVLKNLGTLEELWIWGCDELIYPWESELEACMFLRSLQKFYVHYCPKMQSINVGSGSLREMTIGNCQSLRSYCCPNSVEKLDISSCDSVTSLSFFELQEEDDLPSSLSSSSSNLKFLTIFNCKNIESISQDHLQSLTSLEEMDIRICPSLEDSFPSPGMLWPPNLRNLTIGELQKPLSEWGFQNYPSSLVELSLHGRNSGVVSFRIMEEEQDDDNNNNNNNNNNTISSSCFLLPPSLTFLQIWDFADVESVSEVLQHLPHLKNFYKWGCPKLRDNLPETTSTS